MTLQQQRERVNNIIQFQIIPSIKANNKPNIDYDKTVAAIMRDTNASKKLVIEVIESLVFTGIFKKNVELIYQSGS